MKCILMNKNTEVMTLKYDEDFSIFSNVFEINNIEYAPLSLYNAYNDLSVSPNEFKVKLTEWFKGRGIPDKRDYLDMLLSRLNVDTPTELLDKAYGLSLSDQYWIKPFDSEIEWKDINFFQNDFNDIEFTEATFTTDTCHLSTPITFQTPNNTTDGVLRKTWIIEDKVRYLLKASSKLEILQPFNEWLASEICRRLGFNGVKYDIDILKGNIVSKCPCFIDENTELIPAYQILHNNCDRDNAYEEYINILEEHGIENSREKIENMFILDYLMLNHDRHLNNFGIIRNVETLEWVDVAPIFDTGNSLTLYGYNSDNEVIIEQSGRFFYTQSSFDNIITNIQDITRIDISKLNGIVEEFDDKLHQYQEDNHLSDHNINILCVMLNRQINKLSRLIKKQVNFDVDYESEEDYTTDDSSGKSTDDYEL